MIDKLRELAAKAKARSFYDDDDAWDEWYAAASPDAILALLDERDRLAWALQLAGIYKADADALAVVVRQLRAQTAELATLRAAAETVIEEWRHSGLYEPDPPGLREAIEGLIAALAPVSTSTVRMVRPSDDPKTKAQIAKVRAHVRLEQVIREHDRAALAPVSTSEEAKG